MKKVLYVLTENLSLGVIKSQVLSHVNLLEKKELLSSIFYFVIGQKVKKKKQLLK